MLCPQLASAKYIDTWIKFFIHSFITTSLPSLAMIVVNEFLVSKETVVLRRWERSKQKFDFIKRVDKGWITTVKDLESWRFER